MIWYRVWFEHYFRFIAEIVTKEIKRCANLTILNLDGNTVGVNAAKKIAESLSTHAEFKRAIWKNMFTGRTKEEIPDALVKYLYLNFDANFLNLI